ncbi:conserved hypothetical protein [Lebetimonas natsushimae]|uniref:Polysaccharide chain length determinant N-terminal domain-containing protein n=1 Tax=Lebetimonas natsushimae TaxID=1936991 RepID=A0A292YAS9_9BACT|nr:Wzz/FepE/Etk N-terminal domain-containing protein [Lebetimonas natsushimae]GAX86848.1 conserved hypothetical protein [Lebetimonas natsushimae]
MDKKQQQIIPIQYIPVTQCEEDEIDLKELIKTILKYKKFIVIFTLLITFLAALYAFLKTPVYETKAYFQIGYFNNVNRISINKTYIDKTYIIDPQALKVYIQNNFPNVNANFIKNTKNILNLKIETFSNKEGLNYLNKILSFIHKKEDKKLNVYIKNIKSKINILKDYSKTLQNQIKNLKQQLKTTKDPDIYKSILDNIAKYQKETVTTKLKIADLENQISPVNITKTHIIGKIIQHNHPVKPKKKLIITVAFITGFILSIFLVFFIEFVKNFKEESSI